MIDVLESYDTLVNICCTVVERGAVGSATGRNDWSISNTRGNVNVFQLHFYRQVDANFAIIFWPVVLLA